MEPIQNEPIHNEPMQNEPIHNEPKSKSKILIKVAVVSAIMLLLLLPAWKVEQLVTEREERQKEAVAEVSDKWAGRQLMGGPMLVLPYVETALSGDGKPVQFRHYAYFLPARLDLKAAVSPEERHRGIYKVMLYSAQVQMSGQFDIPDLGALHIRPEQVLWGEAFLSLRLADVRGLNEELTLNWNGSQRLVFSPNVSSDPYSDSSLAAALPLQGPMDLQRFTFAGNLQVNGSQQLLFAPLGKTTTVELQSSWPHPSFSGSGLPQQSSINARGFHATWRSLAHRRNFPQQFRESDRLDNRIYDLSSASFGVDLFVPVNAYQKTLRSVKYCLLCIVLTFTAFFLIEVVNKRSVHPFQYGLIGLALVLFYALLLSFSEYIGFNPAYGVAAAATVGLIGWFVRGLLQSGRLSTLLSAVLVLLYGYVFTILQLQDFALLMGSIGLFLTLAVVMYFLKKNQLVMNVQIFVRRLLDCYRRLDAAEQGLLLSASFPVALSAWRFAYSGSHFFLFLNWNLLLALIPFLISRQLLRRVDWIERRWPFRILFAAWLLFLPNTFYIATDLLHLRQRTGLPLWYDLVLLLAFAWNGLLLGIQSLWQMERVLLARWGLRRGWLFVLPVLALCSFGVYIGRFLRYNSWDVLLAPGGLARDLFDLFRHPLANRFDWSMIICFFGFLVLVYESLRRARHAAG